MNSYKDKSDEQLISLYVDGMNEAFDELLERHKDRIFVYIYRAVKNEELADDIFQDTFVKAIMTIKQGRYVENGHFPAWITRIAHNLIIDYFRQTRAENLQSTDDTDVNILNRKELSECTIEDNLVTNQIHADVRRLVKALPESQREVLEMRYYKNMSFKEIADTTGVSINTALGRMRYAILNMRRLAEEHNITLTL
ncbi:MAG: sigma-70 family RNA polymerase sigma factor [Muribaculaceae bacterium]|nr:sigma-70 family RNA polymerase sigma factor [Muribaculaceae bacterium]